MRTGLEPWKRLGIDFESIISTLELTLELTLEPAWNWLGIEFGTDLGTDLEPESLGTRIGIIFEMSNPSEPESE